ncbi:hypothetical protein ACRC7T_14085 [Segnochrobactraceae bacterium EtOH-i3]
MNALAPIGHNNPPPAEVIEPTRAMLAAWLDEHPVVLTQEDANDAGVTIDRAKRTLKDLEADRDAAVRPLNERVREINTEFREAREPIERLVSEVDTAVKAWMRAEQDRRRREAEEARARQAEIERIAAEKLAAEEAARADAAAGVLDAGIADAIIDTDAALAEAARAKREADRAERDATVRVSGGIGRAMGLRTKKTLRITSLGALLKALTIPDETKDAMLAACLKVLTPAIKGYRAQHGRLPDGVAEDVERV